MSVFPLRFLSLGQFYKIWPKIERFLRQNHYLWLKMGKINKKKASFLLIFTKSVEPILKCWANFATYGLVLVCPCFRENVIVTYKIVSFLCSLNYFLLKNVIVFSCGNQFSKWRSFEKKGYFWPTFHIF